MSKVKIFLMASNARTLLPLIREVLDSRGNDDLIMNDSVEDGHTLVLITRFPASVDEQAFMRAVARRVENRDLAGIRNLHDESNHEHGCRFVIGFRADVNLEDVKRELLDESHALHSATADAAPSALEALTALADSGGSRCAELTIEEDLAKLLHNRADDLAFLQEERGDQKLQSRWEAVAHAIPYYERR